MIRGRASFVVWQGLINWKHSDKAALHSRRGKISSLADDQLSFIIISATIDADGLDHN